MKDLFSGHAQEYATFRPHYPPELYHFLFKYVRAFDHAWDAGTGNGQAAVVLAGRFGMVTATDISEKQLAQAKRLSNITYKVGGEVSALPDQSIDLVTVAQAVHWFDRENFYAEVNRVARPGAIIAIWGYGLFQVDESIDPLMTTFYQSVVGSYWDPERKLIDDEYRSIDFPFDEIPAERFAISLEWDMAVLEGYLNTWSAVQKHIKVNKTNPVAGLMNQLLPLWGSGKWLVQFPVFLRLGRVNPNA
ncbi:MAG: class I SAM-dependent methyltransferase [Cyclobacteriaceae bacterium]|nr:class I SAM-dependent methyltransferase [Cyclobacteriaceae bacterium]